MAKPKLATDGRDSLIVLIKAVQQSVAAELSRSLGEVDVTLTQQAVLVTLLRMPGASNAELARAAFVSPQSMGELIGALERAKLIVRKADPDNARIQRMTVTAAGRKAVARGGKQAAKVEKRLVGAMSGVEQVMLRDLLGRCLDAMHDKTDRKS